MMLEKFALGVQTGERKVFFVLCREDGTVITGKKNRIVALRNNISRLQFVTEDETKTAEMVQGPVELALVSALELKIDPSVLFRRPDGKFLTSPDLREEEWPIYGLDEPMTA